MLVRIFSATTKRTIFSLTRSTSSEPDKKPQFFNPFGECKGFTDVPEPNVSLAAKAKDSCTEKPSELCVEVKPTCDGQKTIKSGGGTCSDGDDGLGNIPPQPMLLKRPEFPGKVRYGFIPEEWFQFFYPKTGVTGPYMFGVGLMTYLTSKEIYVMEHEFYTGISFAILMVYLVKKLGPATAVYADKEIDKHEAAWDNMQKSDIEQLYKDIEEERKEQWRADGALMLIEAKLQMIHMQLETAYREKIMQVYKEIVQKLDYQVECANVEQRLSHKYMMFWLHDQVAKAIREEAGDEMQLEKRKADLSAMVVRIKDFELAEQIKSGSSFNKST